MSKSESGGTKLPSSASSHSSQAHCSTSSCHYNMHTRKTLEFNVRGPACVYISEEDQIIVPGLSILEINFPEASEVGEITVRNYYTAWLSVYIKYVNVHTHVDYAPPDMQGQREDISGWILSIPCRILMPNPHLEHGSHDLVSLVATDSLIEWKKILAIRMYLHQPSPIWRTYYVGEINVYKDLPRLGSKTSKQVPARKTKDGKPAETGTHKESKPAPGPTVANRIIHILKRQTMHSIQWKPSETNSANIFQMPSSAPSYSSNSFAYEVVKLPSV
uniref:Nicolin-1 n=1 Tax=Cacopsylla melanoneura TaxID=428564 RepID=A0A8D8TXY9_9HEMI